MTHKKLARYVTVAGTTYGPSDDVPAEIAEQITNPKAWVAADEQPPVVEQTAGKTGTASGHKLAAIVTVGAHTYGPRDFVPDDIAEKITNPKAWEGGKLPPPAGTPKSPTGDGAKGAETAGSGGAVDDKARKATTPAAKRT